MEEIPTQQELDSYVFNSFTAPPKYIDGDIVIYYPKDGKVLQLVLKKEKYIISGKYGKVYKFSKGLLEYAVKFLKKSDGCEIEAILKMEHQEIKTGKRFNLIKSRIVEASRQIIIMPLMDGDIIDLDKINKLEQNFHTVINSVRKQMDNVLNMNTQSNVTEFAYLDVKPDNVLYRLNENGTYEFVLGDLGSVVKNNGYFTKTYACKTIGCDEYIIPQNCIIRAMRYFYGIFIFTLLYGNYIVEIHDQIQLSELEVLSNNLVSNLGQDYANLLYDPLPETRISMYD